MRSIRNLAVLLALCCALPAARADDLTVEKRADIMRLMQMTGSLSVGRRMGAALATQMSQRLARTRPDIPKQLLDAVPEIVVSVFDANATALTESIIPVYHRNFTAEDIKGLIQFYSTPLGQKSIQVMPAVLQESMTAGRKWADSVLPQVQEQLRSRMKQQGVTI